MSIMSKTHPVLALIALAAMGLSALPAAAQTRGRGPGSPRYDVSTESTVAGTVESVDQVTGSGPGRRRLGGTHITLRTSTETLQIHLGPTAFLAEQQLTLAKGDQLEVVGSRVRVDDDRVVIAKQVTRSGRVWTLRDASGRPLWRGGRPKP